MKADARPTFVRILFRDFAEQPAKAATVLLLASFRDSPF